VKAELKPFAFDALLYLTNRIVAHVPSKRFRNLFYRKVLKFDIARESYIFMGAWFDSRGRFSIGSSSIINQNCRLDNRGGITIGSNVSISADVTLLTADHDVQTSANGRSSSAITRFSVRAACCCRA
jgi:acetyltransferase-like isoleucine patch superfamily enzyme